VRHSGGMRRGLRALSSVLIVSGLLLIVDAALTVFWQEPLSYIYSRLQQGELEDGLAKLEDAGLNAGETRLLAKLPNADRRIAFAARSLARRAKEGQPIGRVRLPRIGLETVMVQGTEAGTLRKGPGHYPDTPLPGVRGTVGVAGHRTTYGAPFRKVDKLRKGDTIEVQMPYATFTYEVEQTKIVAPTAVEVTRRVAYDRLILSACHPLYSAAQRIIVFAKLVDAEPRGSTLI
jgi:sortase A